MTNADSQAHLDSDVAVLAGALGAIANAHEAEVTAAKEAPGAAYVDFTGLDNVTQQLKGLADNLAAGQPPAVATAQASGAAPAPVTTLPASDTVTEPTADTQAQPGTDTAAAAAPADTAAAAPADASAPALPLYEHTGPGDIDAAAWTLADVTTTTGIPLYTYVGDTAGQPPAGASPDWAPYTGTTKPAA